MHAHLVQIDEGREVGRARIREAPLVLGRGDDADLATCDASVSRRHACVWLAGGRHWIRDLGSANGTRVNGEWLDGDHPLVAGDEIEIGEHTRWVYRPREGSPLPGVGVAPPGLLALGALGLVALGALLWSATGRPDPLLEQATQLAESALAHYDRGSSKSAAHELRSAVLLLAETGHLDVPRAEQAEAGLRLLGERMGGDVDLVRVYALAQAASRPVEPPAPTGPCRLDGAPTRDAFERCVRERTERVLRAVWQEPSEVPDRFYGAVREQLDRFLEQRQEFARVLERGRGLIPMMQAALEAEHMPPILHYLALVESAYRTDAVSPADAAGLWQFMPATARAHGLRVTPASDERLDPTKATQAAARYLNGLAFEFGSDALLLTIAAYNKGENGVRRALRQMRDPRRHRSYWSLVDAGLLPRETQDYVPRFVAAAVLGEAGLPPEHLLEAP